MQPILIDGRQFMPQRLVEVIEDTGLASHRYAPCDQIECADATDGGIIAAVFGLGSPPGVTQREAWSTISNSG
jgi:hypothetical protein